LIGIYLGWIRTPSNINNTSLSSLRADYKTDYILMTAEIYNADKNLNQAITSISKVGDEQALRYVQQAIINAEQLGFSQQDLKLLANLSSALQSPLLPTEAK
jgi:hypothetical protein